MWLVEVCYQPYVHERGPIDDLKRRLPEIIAGVLNDPTPTIREYRPAGQKAVVAASEIVVTERSLHPSDQNVPALLIRIDGQGRDGRTAIKVAHAIAAQLPIVATRQNKVVVWIRFSDGESAIDSRGGA